MGIWDWILPKPKPPVPPAPVYSKPSGWYVMQPVIGGEKPNEWVPWPTAETPNVDGVIIRWASRALVLGDGSYDFTKLDARVADCKRRNLRYQLEIFTGTLFP